MHGVVFLVNLNIEWKVTCGGTEGWLGMDYVVTGKNYVSPLVLGLDNGVVVISEDELARRKELRFPVGTRLYLPSESAMQVVFERMDDKERLDLFTKIKDKYECRKLLQPIFPEFYFEKIKLEDLPKLDFKGREKLVVKPEKGFFGTGVKTVHQGDDLAKITEEIGEELKKNVEFFADSVLSQHDLLVEECIEGEEYAVDMFYDIQGMPVILNIYSHPIPQTPYFHVLYYTNKRIFDAYYEMLLKLFERLNLQLKATSLPIHAEFLLTKDNQMVPVELNPLRYGGFGLADLTYYAFSLNPFAAFFDDARPNWNHIWEARERVGNSFGWVLAYNGTGIDVTTYVPNHEKLKQIFPNLLGYHELDYRKNPAFGIAYIKEANEQKLLKLLELEFKDFFVPLDK